MDESLLLPVSHNGQEYEFEMEMIRWTYTHRFRVRVFDDWFSFEPDEEGEYRAIAEAGVTVSTAKGELLKEIGATLSRLMQQ